MGRRDEPSCPPCLAPVKEALCRLVGPEERGECERRCDAQFPGGKARPEALREFVNWPKGKGITREHFLKALDEV